jgi:hypothetical protein
MQTRQIIKGREHKHVSGNMPSMESQFMETLKKQIEENMKKAFWDMLTETMKSDSPDYDWVVRLYRYVLEVLPVCRYVCVHLLTKTVIRLCAYDLCWNEHLHTNIYIYIHTHTHTRKSHTHTHTEGATRWCLCHGP